MFDISGSLFASSYFWAVPLGIAIFFFWFVQYRASRAIKRVGHLSTDLTGKEAARIFLNFSEASSIPVKPGLDYLRNTCDPATGELFISPGFWDDRSAKSVGLAFRAAGLAMVFYLSPGRIRWIRRLDVVEQVLFWIMFTVMGFGLVGEVFSVTLIAYGLFILTLAIFAGRLYLERKMDLETLRIIHKFNLIDSSLFSAITTVVHSDRLTFSHRICAVERPHDPEIAEKISSAVFTSKFREKTANRASRPRDEKHAELPSEFDDFLKSSRKYRQR